jgi:hypothetical protein
MDLLMMGNERMEGLLVRVTANLAAGGVLIPDDRLFQRRISAYLNSPAMNYAFLLNYLLLERLPLYFNEVGATSRIRDYSTEIDSWGNDPVIYFLRKQIHVNASSHNVRLLEHILLSWVRNDLADLREVVPPEIYGQANPGLQKRYSAVIGRFFSQTGVLDAEGLHLDKLLSISDETIDAGLRQTDDDEEARRKAGLLCKLYKEIMRKYGLQNRDAAAGDAHAHLREAISSLSELKRIVLSPEKTEPRESLYFKRHIAFGIPSVLGTYHETKFDALSEMMRRAEEIPVLLEAVVSEVEQSGDADPATRIGQWTTSLTAGWEILKLFGMRNVLAEDVAQGVDLDGDFAQQDISRPDYGDHRSISAPRYPGPSRCFVSVAPRLSRQSRRCHHAGHPQQHSRPGRIGPASGVTRNGPPSARIRRGERAGTGRGAGGTEFL